MQVNASLDIHTLTQSRSRTHSKEKRERSNKSRKGSRSCDFNLYIVQDYHSLEAVGCEKAVRVMVIRTALDSKISVWRCEDGS